MGVSAARWFLRYAGCIEDLTAAGLSIVMPMSPYATAHELTTALRDRRLLAEDALDYALERFRAVNSRINAVIRTDVKAARDQARRLDQMSASGEFAGPLHGLPMTVKDTFDVNGMPAIAGAPQYAKRSNDVADAHAVVQLKNAGAVIWGKTNTPYLAGDNQTFNPIHGLTRNPFDTSRTSGGSSGGSAAALVAGMTSLELGSDIGGSLRLPAHFCGISALKPSFGRISQIGHVPPAPGSMSERELNVVGPMARNVPDLRLMFAALTGRDSLEGRPDLKGRRIAVWTDEETFGLSGASMMGVDRAVSAAGRAGAIVTRARPDFSAERLLDVYLQLVVAVLAEDMPPRRLAMMEMMRPFAHLARGSKPFSRAKWSLYATARYTDWTRTLEQRARLTRAVESFFSSWDAIISPVCAVTAFPHDLRGDVLSRRMRVDGKDMPYVSFLNWIALASTCNLPAVVIPTGLSDEGLPVGVQVIGAHGRDDDVLDIAEAVENELNSAVRPTGY